MARPENSAHRLLMSSSSLNRPTPSTPLHREWDILRAACSPHPQPANQERLRPLLRTSVNWDALLQLANHHGTFSLLFQNLALVSDVTPPGVLTALRQRHQTNIHKSLFLTRELFRILDCLAALGIEAIPYKGLVLSGAYYGDMAMRQSGDMDLFVRAADVSRIKNAVRDLGYTPRLLIPEDAEAAYIASGYEYTFDHPAGRNLLELQWALQPRFYAVDFDMSTLFEGAIEITVAGRRVKTPSPEDLLLVLAVHAAKHVWGRLIWLCDIAQILKHEDLNWSRIQSRARADGIERILHITMLLANRFLEVAIPAPLQSAMQQDPPAHSLAQEIASAVVRGVSYEEEKLSYFHLMMRLREHRMDRLRFLARLTFTPGLGEWEAIRLPRPLFPLYRLVRMARLASRFARGSKASPSW
jgi:hypothetical protein